MKIFDIFKKKPSKLVNKKQQPDAYPEQQNKINYKKSTEPRKINIESITSMQSYPKLPFSFINLSYVTAYSVNGYELMDKSYLNREPNINEKLYLFSGANQEKAKSIILSLNGFIDEAKRLGIPVGPNRIVETDLEFNPISDISKYPFDFFRVNPRTKTGKLTKFPMQISFDHDICKTPFSVNDIFGDIFLLKNGDIGKANINQWYKNKRYGIVLSYENNKTIVSPIKK